MHCEDTANGCEGPLGLSFHQQASKNSAYCRNSYTTVQFPTHIQRTFLETAPTHSTMGYSDVATYSTHAFVVVYNSIKLNLGLS